MKFLLSFFLFISLNIKAQEVDTLKKILKTETTILKSTPTKSFIIPTTLFIYGIISLGDNPIRDLDLSTKAELSEDHPLFAAHVDNYLQFTPYLAMYGLALTGVKGKNSVKDQTAMALMSIGINTALITTIKQQAHRLRPNGSAYNSFPSGHTSTAFAAAELLNQEFKTRLPWLGYAGYTVAAATGILRMYNNKHWLSDVVAGAGFGILSTKLTYLVYPKLKKLIGGPQQNLTILPSYYQNKFGYRITYQIK